MLEAGFPQIVKIAKFFVKLLEEYFYYFLQKSNIATRFGKLLEMATGL
jgi:hypothetical protein